MIGNPKEWRRHLDGCAYLIQAAGINGFSGKEEQALFWCFARMGMKTSFPRLFPFLPQFPDFNQMFVVLSYPRRRRSYLSIIGGQWI